MYITRISYNRSGWTHPTGDARKLEPKSSYNGKHGFGHEDWLFRSEFVLDGWRYAFLQGAGKSLERLRKAGRPFDVRVFCVHPAPDRKRQFVADLEDVEVLSEPEAKEALACFKKNGWLAQMIREVRAIDGGDPRHLMRPSVASNILNIRFRESNVRWFPPGTFAVAKDRVNKLNRYILTRLHDDRRVKGSKARSSYDGSEDLPTPKSSLRSHEARQITVSPTHQLMQKKLMQKLIRENPDARVRRESEGVDVVLETAKNYKLFEIKSELSPIKVIREAIGQLLEYAHKKEHRGKRCDEIVIVGRTKMDDAEAAYFSWLRERVSIPLSYLVVSV